MAYAPVRRSRLPLGSIAGGWAIEPKIDGVWCLVAIDAAGQLASVVGRAGQPLPASWLCDFVRVRRFELPPRPVRTGARGRPRLQRRAVERVERLSTGLPAGLYVAELEAHTERANTAIATRGYARLWFRDVLELGGQDLRRLPNGTRRVLLEEAYRAATDARTGLVERCYLRGPEALAWYEALVAAGGEGVVAHWPEAPYAAPGSAYKYKAQYTVDLAVVRVYRSARGTWKAELAAAHPTPYPNGRPRLVPVQTVTLGRLAAQVVVGSIVEVIHNGALDSGAYRHGRLSATGPRGLRLLRVRLDKDAPDTLEAVDEARVEAVAAHLRVSARTVRRWTWAGLLPRRARGRYDLTAVRRAVRGGLRRRGNGPVSEPVPHQGWFAVGRERFAYVDATGQPGVAALLTAAPVAAAAEQVAWLSRLASSASS